MDASRLPRWARRGSVVILLLIVLAMLAGAVLGG